jgi:hypothetical protein
MLAGGCLQMPAAMAQVTQTTPTDPVVIERAKEAIVLCEWPDEALLTKDESRSIFTELGRLYREAEGNKFNAQLRTSDEISLLRKKSVLGLVFEEVGFSGWGLRIAAMSWSPNGSTAQFAAHLRDRGYILQEVMLRGFSGFMGEKVSPSGKIMITVAAGSLSPTEKISDQGITVTCSNTPSPAALDAEKARQLSRTQ